MRLQEVTKCDQMFKALCALHNRLIKVDGLNTNWMGIRQGNTTHAMDVQASLRRVEEMGVGMVEGGEIFLSNYNCDLEEEVEE